MDVSDADEERNGWEPIRHAARPGTVLEETPGPALHVVFTHIVRMRLQDFPNEPSSDQ